jgi:acylphosphatase
MSVCRKVVVKEAIQDSGYQEQAQLMAPNPGVSGWVRNASNRDVDACFEGDEGGRACYLNTKSIDDKYFA